MSFLYKPNYTFLSVLDAVEFIGCLFVEMVDYLATDDEMFAKTKITVEGEVFHLQSAEISSNPDLEIKNEIHLKIKDLSKTFFYPNKGQTIKQFPLELEVSLMQNYEALTNYNLIQMAQTINSVLTENHYIYSKTIGTKTYTNSLEHNFWKSSNFNLDNNEIKLVYEFTINQNF